MIEKKIVDIPLYSAVQGIDWPALPAPSAAGKLAALFQLEQSQWWSSEDLRKHQFRQIDVLLRHCAEHVPYYQAFLGQYISSDIIDDEQWLKIPLLTRDKLQQAGEKLRTTMMPAGHGKVKLLRTSGSTGKPVEVLGSEMTAFFWNVFSLRDHLWHRRDFSGKLAVIRYSQDESAKPPHGYRLTNWGGAIQDVSETGVGVMINIHTPLSEQISWLQAEDPDYILTHPSVLQALAMHCQREAIQLPALREVRTMSEALPDGLRELCRSVWGVKLVDMYTTTEAGYLALQCPEHDQYHVQSEGVLLEVLDDDGKPCAPGEVGRVVITSLHNFATPLVRYELGDFAEVGEACPCGRGQPVIKRILGRYRNLVTLPNGERRWPKFGIEKMLKLAPVLQYQAIQHTIHEIEYRLVMAQPLSNQARQALLALFGENLHPEISVTISEVDSIPRSASGKYEEFVSKL